MKIKLVYFCFLLLVFLSLFCGCDNGVPHVHSFESSWTYDLDNHWHASTCEHKEEISSLGAHSFNEEYVCVICGYKEDAPHGTQVLSSIFKSEGNSFYYTVSAQTSYITLFDKFVYNNRASVSFAKSLEGSSELEKGILPLDYGDNVCYMTVTRGKEVSVYSVVVHRNAMCKVSFDSNGGELVESQEVEEGSTIKAPVTTKEGYKFDGWDFDFSQPILADIVITAKWIPLDDIQYVIEYYLENADGTFEKTDSLVLFGKSDSVAKVPEKNYDHYSLVSDIDNIKISPDGSTVIKAKYERNSYLVRFDPQGGTLVKGDLEQSIKYEQSAIAPVLIKEGFDFVGFDKAYNNVSSNIVVNAVWNTKEKLNYDTSSIEFKNKSFVYDGVPHSIEATGLPDGVTVSYENNDQTEVGAYTVTAKFHGDYDTYNVIPDITAILEIQKANYDMTSFTFESKTVVYDGNVHSLIAKNVPEGVKVNYTNNDKIDSGKYLVKASFEGDYDHYNTISEYTAVLTINKADIDISQIEFNDLSVVYDGKPHSVSIKNIPSGVTAQYNMGPKTDAGSYTYEAILIPDNNNFNTVTGLSAKLVIEKARINTENIIFNNKKIKFDGAKHSVTLQNLPSEIKPENVIYYYNGVKSDGVSESGEYTVIASFQLGENYITPSNLQATLEIYRENYIEKYKSYPELGKTIDLINASEFKVKTGTKSVFSDEIYYYPVEEYFIGNETGSHYYASSAESLIKDFHLSINAKISFGPRENKNGAFMTNKLPRIDFANTGAYQRKKNSETKEFHYIYEFLKEGKEVSINGFNTAEDLTPILSDDLINDVLKVRNGVYSAAEFIERWGTHVIMAAKYGARVDVSYDALSTSEEKYEDWTSNISFELEKRFKKTSINVEADVGTNYLETSTNSEEIKRLTIRSKSKNVVGLITSIEEMPKFFEAWSNKYNPETDNVFIDVPDRSLYCIWHLLGSEYDDVKNILDEYVSSACESLNEDYVSRINNLKMNDDICYSADEKTLYINIDNIQEIEQNVSVINTDFASRNPEFFEDGTLVIYPTFNYQSIERVVITGKYGLMDSKGREIKTQVEDFSLKLAENWNNSIEIVVKNLNVKSVNGMPVFDLGKCPDNISLLFEGKNNIESSSSLSPAISSNNLVIRLCDENGTTVITGHPGVDNQEGGIGIISETISVLGEGNILINGGNGGNGVGHNGKDGKPGKDGAEGVQTASILFDINGNVCITGGNAGNGADGLAGDNGAPGSRYDVWFSKAGNGGHGGTGGKGGNSGLPSSAISFNNASVDIVYNNGHITMINGNGGSGGTGGKGGDGGNGGNSNAWGTEGGDAGNAGNGGAGGDGSKGATLNIASPFISSQTGIDGIVGKGGQPGSVGKPGFYDGGGGDYGVRQGKQGQPGTSGIDGNLV